MIGRALLAVAVMAVAVAAPAAAAPTVFTNTDEVRACLPLAGGDTFVGTAGGLVRVDIDGAARKVWTAGDGLPGTRIDALFEDGDRVWIGSDGGVAEIAVTAGAAGAAGATASTAAAANPTGAVATRPVRDILRWRGKLYLATWDGGVIELGGSALAMTGGAEAARMRAAALAVSGGTLWAGTAAGLYRMRNGKLEHVAGPREVTALLAARGALWIGTSDGVWKRDADGIRPLGGDEVRHLALVDGAIVAAGADGLSIVDRGRVARVATSPQRFAQTVAAGDGRVCTGALDRLWLRTPSGWHEGPHRDGPPSNDISAIAADGARLWVGTFDHGLAVRDDHGWRAIAGTDPRINAVMLEPRPDGARLWVATAEGIQVVDAAGATVLRLGKSDGLPSRSVLSLARLRDGRIVAGTSVGAAFVDGGKVRRVGPRIPDRGAGNVWAIAETSAGLWLGTTTGLYRGPATAWTSKDGSDDDAALAERWQRMSVASGQLRDDWVTALVTRDDVVWAGTYHGGVVRIEGAAATALDGGWINPGGLAWDGDRLLAATMDGLIAGDGRAATWTATPGLPGRDVTAAVRTGTSLWIATRRGLIAMN